MIRFIMGLSLACLIAGCGEPAAETDTKTDETKDASVTTPATDTAVATSDHTDAAEENHATEDKPAAAAAPTLMTVKFKVPGMS
ncbi:MAG: hypothetical protein AB8G99_16065 [Planctomycetaceae bacterium]